MDAQEKDYPTALAEVKNGRKRSHWMWYIFPQIAGLGFSETSRYYAINNLDEAKHYLAYDILGHRLIEISNELLRLSNSNAREIFGSPDDLKLKSSMTLFAQVESADEVFRRVLDKFFDGNLDVKTLEILKTK